MKINNAFAPNQLVSSKGFELSLSKPTPTQQLTGDEYYWQHQHQLQNSALCFKTILQNVQSLNTQSTNNNQSIMNHFVKEKPTHLDMTASHQIHPAFSNPAHYLEIEFHQTMPNLLKQAAQIAPSLSQPNYHYPKNDVVNYKSQTRNITPIQPRFKNYQLFIQANQAELSLNTTFLTIQQTNELKKLIQQWFARKGILLRQLIMNGVNQ